MVRLAITPALAAALEHCSELDSSFRSGHTESEQPIVGNPISHLQVLQVHKCLRQHAETNPGTETEQVAQYDLDTLLRGSHVYVEPTKPKPEPSDEYKALMARLRAEEEERRYNQMLNPPSQAQSFSQQFPNSPYAHLFPDAQAGGPRSLNQDGVVHDEMSFRDINRQLTLIANVLVSIVACSVAIWWATWHWTTGWRLGASMGGSGLVGVAEVVVYMGYISRMGMAKDKERKKKERKTVAKTWVIEGRKGVIEKRVVGAEDTAVTGSDWLDAPAAIRQRGKTGM